MNYAQYLEVEETINKAYQNWYSLTEIEKENFKIYLLEKNINCFTVYDNEDYKAAKEKLAFVSNEQDQFALSRLCLIYENYKNEGSTVAVSYGEEGFAIWMIDEAKTINPFLSGMAALGVTVTNYTPHSSSSSF